MKREIQYRGIIVPTFGLIEYENKKRFVYGSLIVTDPIHPIICTAPVENRFEVLPETVGQYTGFRYRDGEKVFEGDVLEMEHRFTLDPLSGMVVWNRDTGGFWLASLDDPSCGWSFSIVSNLRKLGDVFNKKLKSKYLKYQKGCFR